MSTGVLLVGLGAIGLGYDLVPGAERFVQTHARAFSAEPFALLAGVDPDGARRALFEQSYRAPAFADLDAALASVRPDVVVIATPTRTHASTLARVLELAQPRLVLCEKPLAPDVADAQRMLDACERAGVALYVNYFRRSLPGMVEVRRRLELGALRDCKGVSWYSKGLLHNGSHFLGLLEYWLGAVRSAQRIGRLHPGPAGPEPDCRIVFEGGEVQLLATHDPAFAHQELELVGRDGRLRLDSAGRLQWQSVVPDPANDGYHVLSSRLESIESGIECYQAHVAGQLARALAGLPAELCSGADALRVQLTIAELETATATETCR